MLVLSRKVGEAIVIDGRVLVTVAAMRSNSVSLGISAPDSVRIDRGEIHALRKAAKEPTGTEDRAAEDGDEGESACGKKEAR